RAATRRAGPGSAPPAPWTWRSSRRWRWRGVSGSRSARSRSKAGTSRRWRPSCRAAGRISSPPPWAGSIGSAFAIPTWASSRSRSTRRSRQRWSGRRCSATPAARAFPVRRSRASWAPTSGATAPSRARCARSETWRRRWRKRCGRPIWPVWRRQGIGDSTDLRALLAHLTERAAPVLARRPHVPEEKALLSTDGGVCPDDGAPLVFDPWSPHAHRCARCGRTFTGERHDRNWARYQHLWLAERAAHLAALAALDGNEAAGARAAEILRAYARSYLRYPNRDNVLGPSRLFFSTYLESLWV